MINFKLLKIKSNISYLEKAIKIFLHISKNRTLTIKYNCGEIEIVPFFFWESYENKVYKNKKNIYQINDNNEIISLQDDGKAVVYSPYNMEDLKMNLHQLFMSMLSSMITIFNNALMVQNRLLQKELTKNK